MMIAALVIFSTVWNAVGGWSGLEEKLIAHDARTGERLADRMHVGGYQGDHDSVSPYVIVLGWTIVGSGYWTVNHTQTMRLMGSRSLTDMKYAAIFGVLLSLPVMVISACLGVFGHGIANLPNLQADEIYPWMANRFLGPGFKGIVVAGVVAAVVSTFDSMGSALSAIFTRDVYARLIAPNRSDKHYVIVGRFATAGVLLIGFAYLPFIWKQEHMLKAFTTLIPVLVTPLFTVYMLGVFTRVHRRSGIVGLVCGAIYGVIALYDRQFHDLAWLPTWFTERWVAYSWSILFTLVPMLLVTAILGAEDLAKDERWTEKGWLERSREELPPFALEQESSSTIANLLAVGLLLFCAWVTLVWLW